MNYKILMSHLVISFRSNGCGKILKVSCASIYLFMTLSIQVLMFIYVIMLISFLLSLLQNLDSKLSKLTIHNAFDVLAIMRLFFLNQSKNAIYNVLNLLIIKCLMNDFMFSMWFNYLHS
jgi:hypothetical protein